MKSATKRVTACIIGRLMCNIEELGAESQELKKAIVIESTKIVNMIASEFKESELKDRAVIPVYICAVKSMANKLNQEYEYTAFSGALLHAIMQAISQTKQPNLLLQARIALSTDQSAFFSDSLSTAVQTQLGIMVRDPLPDEIGKHIIVCTLSALYKELQKDTADEKAILLALALVL